MVKASGTPGSGKGKNSTIISSEAIQPEEVTTSRRYSPGVLIVRTGPVSPTITTKVPVTVSKTNH